jgi:hypothetical protein
VTRNHRATREDRHFTEEASGKGRVRRPYIANPDMVERLATGPPLAEVGWETVYGSGPRGDFDYPAIHSIVSEALGSWASFMRGIQL